MDRVFGFYPTSRRFESCRGRMGFYCTICKVNDAKIHTHRKRDIEDVALPERNNSEEEVVEEENKQS